MGLLVGVLVDWTTILRPERGLDLIAVGLRGGDGLFSDVFSPEPALKDPLFLTAVGLLLDLNVMDVVTVDPVFVVFLVASGLFFWPEEAAFVAGVFEGGPLSFLLLRGLETFAVSPLPLDLGGSTVALPLRGLDFGDSLYGDRGLDFGDPLTAALILRGGTGERLLVVLVL